MKAILEIGGKQFTVKENEIINVDRISGEKRQTLTFKNVLLITKENETKIGTPFVNGAEITAEIIDHIRGEKITVFKMKRRKGYKRKQGHRQELTKIKITQIKD